MRIQYVTVMGMKLTVFVTTYNYIGDPSVTSQLVENKLDSQNCG